MDLEIRPVAAAATGASGASAVHVLGPDKLLVRQGQLLILFGYPELVIVQQTFMPISYQGGPFTVTPEGYHELFYDRETIVDVETMEQRSVALGFTMSMECTFLQYGPDLLINDRGDVFVYNLLTRRRTDVARFAPQFTNVMQLGPHALLLASHDQNLVYRLDTRQAIKFNKDNFGYPGCFQVRASEEATLCFGLQNFERDYRRTQIGVLWPHTRRQEQYYVIYRGDGTLHEARPAFCDDLCFVADGGGTLLVLRSDLFRLAVLNAGPLELGQDRHVNPAEYSEHAQPVRVCGPTFWDKVNFFSGR